MAIPSGYTALDFVGFTDKGTYANNVTYVINDLVHYGGDIWKCKIDNIIGITPAVGANWEQWLGASANLVERIIAPLEQNPATVAYAIGRQIIYDDWLWEVIAPIAIGDTLVDYAVDPTNANIKKAPAVETQLLALSSKAYQTDDSTETDIADDDLLPFYDTSATARKKSTWSNIIAKIKAKLGTASSKDVPTSGNASATQVVMGNDTRLTDARNAADVSAWAKAANKPSYTASEISYGTGSNVGSEIQTLTNKVTTFEGNIAPIENGTNYSTDYSKGTQFMRNDMLYEVTASSVNSSTAINTGTGGNAKLAKPIVDQIASNRTIIDGTFSTYYVVAQQWRTLAELTVPSDGVYLLVANARSETGVENRSLDLKIVRKSDGGTICGQTSRLSTNAGANCCIILNATANQAFTYNVYSSADSQIRIDNAVFRAFKLL